MPDYRLKTPLMGDAQTFGRQMGTLVEHAQPYAMSLSNPRFVSGYFTFTSAVAIPVAIRNHLDLEAAP